MVANRCRITFGVRFHPKKLLKTAEVHGIMPYAHQNTQVQCRLDRSWSFGGTPLPPQLTPLAAKR